MTSTVTGAPLAIVFTDLDGTLLDHESYACDPARPALDALKSKGVPLVLASSKTAAEIAELHAVLGLGDAPAIVENGAGLWRPGAGEADDTDYRAIREALDDLPTRLRVLFRGFGDMSAYEVAHITGLSRDAAARARARAHSEPGLWSGDPELLAEALRKLGRRGIHARRGGRFLTLSMGGTKADRMAEVMAEYGAPHSLALGDAPNDAEMLETAERGVIVRNDHGTPLPRLAGEDAGRITRTDAPGPTGWNRAVLDWLSDLTADRAPNAPGTAPPSTPPPSA